MPYVRAYRRTYVHAEYKTTVGHWSFSLRWPTKIHMYQAGQIQMCVQINGQSNSYRHDKMADHTLFCTLTCMAFDLQCTFVCAWYMYCTVMYTAQTILHHL